MDTRYMMASAAALLLLVAAMGTPAQAEDEREFISLTIGEDGETTWGVDNHGSGHAECRGHVPLEFWCSTGDHTRGVPMSVGFWAILDSSFTGVLETVVIDESGDEVRYNCDFSGGVWAGTCNLLVTSWPDVGERFTHECWAYTQTMEPLSGVQHGVADLPQTGLGGIPPGEGGPTNCFVRI